MMKRKLSQAIEVVNGPLDGERAGKLSRTETETAEKISPPSPAPSPSPSPSPLPCVNVDVYSRTKDTKTEGRGSLAGWTACPLCNANANTNTNKNANENAKQTKKYALGRGISMHLQQVHTPWKPGKAELARRQRIRRRVQGIVYRTFQRRERMRIDTDTDPDPDSDNKDKCSDLKKDKLLAESDAHFPIPEVHKGESQEEYRKRLLKFHLGDVWDRVGTETCKGKGKGKDKGQAIMKGIKGRPTHYEPSDQEVQAWSKKVLDMARELERKFELEFETKSKSQSLDVTDKNNNVNDTLFVAPGLDRNGSRAHSYQESLPPFIKAASDGNLQLLKQMVRDVGESANMSSEGQVDDRDNHVQVQPNHAMAIKALLETKDRNGSSAEHWAAGNGHLECLRYLMSLHTNATAKDAVTGTGTGTGTDHDRIHQHQERNSVSKKRRRRDGKTALHYAARNGQTHILRYLLDEYETHSQFPNTNANTNALQHINVNVDIASGDGTTPLHLACYGGHLSTIRYLIEEKGADAYRVNDWECGVGHWIAMSVQSDKEELMNILDYVKNIVRTRSMGGRKSNGSDISNSDNNNNNNNNNIKNRSFQIFGRVQKHGHSSIHKAAQKLNRHIIEWLGIESKGWTKEERMEAWGEDKGGNKPSAIWAQMGGTMDFRKWMERELEKF